MADLEVLAHAGRWLDPAWYSIRNPDVARVGIDPVAHYVRYGEAEGRFPSSWFDPAWYRRVHALPPERSALEHFLLHRHTGDFPPNAALWLAPRTPPGRDALATGEDPFDRYLTAFERPEHELLPDLAGIQASGLIDALYFQINPLGLYENELDPALHYCRFGWWRGLRPSTAFDPDWYGETNPAVPWLGINPLTHYILDGEAANRRPVPWFDPAWYRSAYAVAPSELALAHYLRHRKGRAVSPNPLFDVDWYVGQHGNSIPAEVDPFSHYLLRGALEDIDPSPRFDTRGWRHRHMAPLGSEGQSELPVAARNPLVHHLRTAHAAS